MNLGVDSDRITLYSDGTELISQRPGRTGFEAFYLSGVLFLVLIVDLLGIMGIVLAAKCAITEKYALCFLMMVVLLLAILPALLVTIIVQGLLFSFRASYNQRTGVLRIKYGLFRLKRKLDPENVLVKIEPTYSRGDWGYRAKIKAVNGRFSLVFIPSGIIGGRRKAFNEALEISQWLKKQGIAVEMDTRFSREK